MVFYSFKILKIRMSVQPEIYTVRMIYNSNCRNIIFLIIGYIKPVECIGHTNTHCSVRKETEKKNLMCSQVYFTLIALFVDIFISSAGNAAMIKIHHFTLSVSCLIDLARSLLLKLRMLIVTLVYI